MSLAQATPQNVQAVPSAMPLPSTVEIPSMLSSMKQAIDGVKLFQRTGRISRVLGLCLESIGPDAALGELCWIQHHDASQKPALAQVVGLSHGKVMLMPFDSVQGIALGAKVLAIGQSLQVPVGASLLGRVVNALGTPIDDGAALACETSADVYAAPISPLKRMPISELMNTGIKAIDAFLPIGQGQRMGIFAGSGVGKSTLLGMLAKGAFHQWSNHNHAEVSHKKLKGHSTNNHINVIALIGERGREVGEFLHEVLGKDGLKQSIVVVATSDESALMRTTAAYTACAYAEFFRNQGKHVLLMMDSITRYAMAEREIGLAIGEPATARGYTPSVFAKLPKLLERAGHVVINNAETQPNKSNHPVNSASITGIYTVLVEGDDMNEPIADHARATLDGHIVLSRALAQESHYPAIDVLQSISRLSSRLHSSHERHSVEKAVKAMALVKKYQDMVEVGAYQMGTNPKLDKALLFYPKLMDWMRQNQQYEAHPIGLASMFEELNNMIAMLDENKVQ